MINIVNIFGLIEEILKLKLNVTGNLFLINVKTYRVKGKLFLINIKTYRVKNIDEN